MIALLISAVCSALLLTAAYPHLALWPVSAVALAPFLTVLFSPSPGRSWRQVWLASYVFSAVWHLSCIWWISYVTGAGMVMLALFISLFLASMLTLGWWLVRRGYPALLVIPMVWIVFEAIVTYFLSGFPWLLLGYTWRPWITGIQTADLAGVYAVSYIIICINTALARALVSQRAGEPLRKQLTPIGIAAAIVAGALVYGAVRETHLARQSPQKQLRIACIQANIESEVKHNPSKDRAVLEKYHVLSSSAVRERPDIIIWPETSIPGYYFEGGLNFRMVTNILRDVSLPVITGMARYSVDPATGTRRFYNCAGLIQANGFVSSIYDKRHLVIFGEYVPFEQYLPFLKKVTPIAGSFSAGRQSQPLYQTVNGEMYVFGPLICFEDVFGYLSRDMARAGAEILVNLTNDGWFHSSPEPYQHAALSAFRAVETRLPLIRSTNSGITMVIDNTGRTIAVLEKGGKRTEIYGVLYATVPVHAAGLSLYTRFGDWFLVLWSLTAIVIVLYEIVRIWRGRHRR